MGTPDVWKEFERNGVTHSVAHHLAAIHDLREQRGYARVSDVARHLGITRGSVSLTLRALREKSYVQMDQNKFLSLSDKGHRIIHTVLARRRIVLAFLGNVLRVGRPQAKIDACRVEHLLSMETGETLCHFVRFLLSDAPVARKFLQAFWDEKSIRCNLEEYPVCGDECLLQVEEQV